jgi:hypothetical protein
VSQWYWAHAIDRGPFDSRATMDTVRLGRVTAIAAAALATAAPAFGSAVHTTGDVVVRWHGDAARGCADVGLCDYSGQMVITPWRDADLELTRFSSNITLGQSYLTTRVNRAGGGRCAAASDPDFPLDFELVEGSLGGAAVQSEGLSTGRCGGPLAEDLESSLPRATFSLAELRRKPLRLDLSGTTPFAAGPFSGDVVSTLVVDMARARRRAARDENNDSFPEPPVPKRLRGRIAGVLQMDFTTGPLTGTIGADLGGFPEPGCTPFDTCGLSGKLDYALDVPSATVFVTSWRLLPRGRSSESLSEARRAFLAGRTHVVVNVESGSDSKARVTEELRPGGGSVCRDGHDSDRPQIVTARARNGIRMALLASSSVDPDTDVVRTRCPGPLTGDVLANDRLASGVVPLRALLERRAALTLAARGSFARGGYLGLWHGGIRVGLERTGRRVRTIPAAALEAPQ